VQKRSRSGLEVSVLPRPAKSRTIPWRREHRADHIYRAAAEIMCRKGYEATSMNDIAEAVGLTKAGIYHYIRGKEDLLFQIMSFAMDMVETDVIAHARQVPDAEERLRPVVERHARRILEVGGAVTIILEEMPGLTPSHRRTIKQRKRAYFELVQHTLVQLAAEGKLRELNPSVGAFTLFGMILWISRWYRRDGVQSAEQVLRDLVEMALNAVLRSATRVESGDGVGERVLAGASVSGN
jgi:AcrR family transcriptional regulator